MSSKHILAACACVALAACSQAPEKTIEQECVRLNLFSDINSAADLKTSCSCLAGKLKDSMSEKDLKNLAKMLKDSKKSDDFDANAKKYELSDAAAMTFVGAAKSCAFQ